jgi:UDP-N-acetylmuramoyl-L-alanyl-D-glutamate--2,6-diaminopimelate ligase
MNSSLASIVPQLHARAPHGAKLRQDSRAVTVGDIFVAFSGDVHDGRQFIDAAIQAGASAVLADRQGLTASHSRVIAVENLKQSLGTIAHAFYGKPSEQIDCIGVTGTNGKTTVTHWLAQLLECLQGKPSALLGTLGAGLLGHTQTTGLTTPHASDVHRFLAQAIGQGAGSACIEATSIGLVEGRLNAVAFTVAAFTNLTQDHLDYHGTMLAYGGAKRALFQVESLKTAVINLEDPFGAELLAELAVQRPTLKLISTGMGEPAMLRATDIATQANASQSFTVQYKSHSYPAQLPALGRFNVDNALTALGCCIALGYKLDAAIDALSTLTGVPGRMQVVGDSTHSPLVVVDFAHTPDGLLQALTALKPVAAARGGALSVVFGCGGNRDASKRPLMGAMAQEHADKVIISNDNPRDEAPDSIAAHIASAASKASIVLERAQAIAQAIAQATPADVVLIAGKGHETTQTIAGVVSPFSDIEHALAALTARRAGSL